MVQCSEKRRSGTVVGVCLVRGIVILRPLYFSKDSQIFFGLVR